MRASLTAPRCRPSRLILDHFFSKNGSLVFQVSTGGFQSLSWVVDSLQKVAEPATLALFAFGLAGLGLVARKRVRT